MLTLIPKYLSARTKSLLGRHPRRHSKFRNSNRVRNSNGHSKSAKGEPLDPTPSNTGRHCMPNTNGVTPLTFLSKKSPRSSMLIALCFLSGVGGCALTIARIPTGSRTAAEEYSQERDNRVCNDASLSAHASAQPGHNRPGASWTEPHPVGTVFVTVPLPMCETARLLGREAHEVPTGGHHSRATWGYLPEYLDAQRQDALGRILTILRALGRRREFAHSRSQHGRLGYGWSRELRCIAREVSPRAGEEARSRRRSVRTGRCP